MIHFVLDEDYYMRVEAQSDGIGRSEVHSLPIQSARNELLDLCEKLRERLYSQSEEIGYTGEAVQPVAQSVDGSLALYFQHAGHRTTEKYWKDQDNRTYDLCINNELLKLYAQIIDSTFREHVARHTRKESESSESWINQYLTFHELTLLLSLKATLEKFATDNGIPGPGELETRL